jgi:hypothetical protein
MIQGRGQLNCSLSHTSRASRFRKNVVHMAATPGYVRDPVNFPTSGMRIPPPRFASQTTLLSIKITIRAVIT